jgi:hypothetical protein
LHGLGDPHLEFPAAMALPDQSFVGDIARMSMGVPWQNNGAILISCLALLAPGDRRSKPQSRVCVRLFAHAQPRSGIARLLFDGRLFFCREK